MSSPLVVMTPEALLALVRAAVREELAARAAANEAPSDWLNTEAAATILGVSTRQVAKMAAGAKGRPPALASSRVGRLLRFRRSDVLAVLEGR